MVWESVVKNTEIEIVCFEYIIFFILETKQSPVKILVNQNEENAKSKWSF